MSALDQTPDPLEDAINRIIDQEPILEDPNLDPMMLSSFTTDVAEDLHPPEDIAIRYGFTTGEQMVAFIAKHRGVRRQIKEKRAAFTANVSIEVRNRKKANFIVGEVMATMGAPMFDPKTPAAVRLDTLKVFSRMAGIDGMPAGSLPGQQNHGQAGFTVNFLFSGQATQTITTVVDAEAGEIERTTLIMPDLPPMPEHFKAIAAPEPPPEPEMKPEPVEINPHRPGLAGFALRDHQTQGVATQFGGRR